MKRYLIETSVQRAEGSQCWYVDASSEAEALQKYKNGDGDIYSSDVDVTALGEPEICGKTELDDFGECVPKPAQPAKPLTVDSVQDALAEHPLLKSIARIDCYEVMQLVRIIEAAHGIKGTHD